MPKRYWKKSLSLLLLWNVTVLSVMSCGSVMPQNAQIVDVSVETAASAEQDLSSEDDSAAQADADASRFTQEQADMVAADAYELMCEIATQFPDRDAHRKGNDHADFMLWLEQRLHAFDGIGALEMQHFVSTDAKAFENAEMCNFILTVPGKDPSRQIVVGAHFDGTGVGDNASGVALLLALIEGISGKTPDVTLRFVFFDEEEYGEFGSYAYTGAMTEEEIAATLFYVNLDSLAFGDYCHLYGGVSDRESGAVTQTEAYDLAVSRAKALGFSVYDTDFLDGYYETFGAAPPADDRGFFTNPWTFAHPMPSIDTVREELVVFSPATMPHADHTPFAEKGIPYLYLEATNWFAGGDPKLAFTGYYETADASLGEGGMFMNTKYDTPEQLESLFPGRARAHFELCAPLLLSLLLHPEG